MSTEIEDEDAFLQRWQSNVDEQRQKLVDLETKSAPIQGNAARGALRPEIDWLADLSAQINDRREALHKASTGS